jgi:hypothetical protein
LRARWGLVIAHSGAAHGASSPSGPTSPDLSREAAHTTRTATGPLMRHPRPGQRQSQGAQNPRPHATVSRRKKPAHLPCLCQLLWEVFRLEHQVSHAFLIQRQLCGLGGTRAGGRAGAVSKGAGQRAGSADSAGRRCTRARGTRSWPNRRSAPGFTRHPLTWLRA